MKTDQELSRFSESHLAYEIEMLFSTIWIEIPPKTERSSYLHNWRIEVFCLHARSLIEFLYYERGNKRNDAYAEKYFSNENDWHSCRPTKSQILQPIWRRASTEIHHLTFDRSILSEEAKNWDLCQIASELLQILKVFCENAHQSKLSHKVKETVEFWAKHRLDFIDSQPDKRLDRGIGATMSIFNVPSKLSTSL